MQNVLLFIPNIERGGIEKNLVILSNYFFKKNYNVEVLYGKISPETQKKINKKITLIKCKKVINTEFFSNRIMNTINCFLYLLINYKFKKKQLILSFQDHPFSILISKIKKIPCILRIANHPLGSLSYFNNNLIFFIKINIKKIFYFFASGIICNSKASTSFFKRIYKNKKIINIYNPIQLIIIKKKYKKNNDYIISVGRLQNQKNFSGLIKAFKLVAINISNIKLVIVGSGSEEKYLRNLSYNLKISNRVLFVKYKNANQLICSAKLFVLNSLWEGLPNILIETQMLKTPILSSDCLSGPNEILEYGKLGYLSPVNDEKKLAKKINYIYKNYPKALKKAALGFRRLNRFDYSQQCKKYEYFLNKFI
tara:strand:+ start:11132 stop:12232 length:1101 start_codon:yes stop_codon:yes gene_type:complete